jgi:hypothetical protein
VDELTSLIVVVVVIIIGSTALLFGHGRRISPFQGLCLHTE